MTGIYERSIKPGHTVLPHTLPFLIQSLTTK
jgi:hypothetical protein